MDGDGSIQVNHWRSKSLQYRLVIKLKNCSENLYLLNLIRKSIGGFVRIVSNDKFVIWVVNNKKDIRNIIKIFSVYPHLTSRLKAQYFFMLNCLKLNNVDWYFNNRNNKYLFVITKLFNCDFSYFNEWLSGFIEAEGSFSIRTTKNNHSFSIGQKKDKYILENIKTHFNITNQIRLINNDFWFLEVYKKSVLTDIINHLNNYPLLGEKKLSFKKFKNLFL